MFGSLRCCVLLEGVFSESEGDLVDSMGVSVKKENGELQVEVYVYPSLCQWLSLRGADATATVTQPRVTLT